MMHVRQELQGFARKTEKITENTRNIEKKQQIYHKIADIEEKDG